MLAVLVVAACGDLDDSVPATPSGPIDGCGAACAPGGVREGWFESHAQHQVALSPDGTIVGARLAEVAWFDGGLVPARTAKLAIDGKDAYPSPASPGSRMAG